MLKGILCVLSGQQLPRNKTCGSWQSQLQLLTSHPTNSLMKGLVEPSIICRETTAKLRQIANRGCKQCTCPHQDTPPSMLLSLDANCQPATFGYEYGCLQSTCTARENTGWHAAVFGSAATSSALQCDAATTREPLMLGNSSTSMLVWYNCCHCCWLFCCPCVQPRPTAAAITCRSLALL